MNKDFLSMKSLCRTEKTLSKQPVAVAIREKQPDVIHHDRIHVIHTVGNKRDPVALLAYDVSILNDSPSLFNKIDIVKMLDPLYSVMKTLFNNDKVTKGKYTQLNSNTSGLIRIRADKTYQYEDIQVSKLYDKVCCNGIPRKNKSYHEMFDTLGGNYRLFFDVDSKTKEHININQITEAIKQLLSRPLATVYGAIFKVWFIQDSTLKPRYHIYTNIACTLEFMKYIAQVLQTKINNIVNDKELDKQVYKQNGSI